MIRPTPEMWNAFEQASGMRLAFISFEKGVNAMLAVGAAAPQEPLRLLFDTDIERIALECGFKKKEQQDGRMALNPYVYTFARQIIAASDVRSEAKRNVYATPPAQEDEQVAHDMLMDAYYYSFGSTGVLPIDKILSAVACAGKAYHHTECWTDEASPYPHHTGKTPADWIQKAADEAAKSYTRPDSELRKTAELALADIELVYDTTDGLVHDSLYRAMISLRAIVKGKP